ncbi:EF-hand domain-containing protein 1-like [Boleophthalmus pectinirostris]|uniref:EF-hand domain-containing protein 1-like n=1 Tax=Boleophthalmus pectinirostris TaxID=150288 RepID=UPI00243100D6|nr:EF-hand domain-containing protein 1-like [Boleophthalmus pectinirostris]
MSWNWKSHGLPFLPGYSFQDVTKTAFHRPQTLGYKNGYALPRRPTIGIGQSPLLSAQLRLQELNQLPLQEHEASYDAYDISQCEDFIPAYVVLDKKVLRFYAYFTEDVLYSPEEHYRVRSVVIYYFLEDDTMCVIEPTVENSGIPQGKRIKRQRLPKNEFGEYYTWTDLNVAMDMEVYGVKYHIVDCDAFTKEFLASEGIILNVPEPMPSDPYITDRTKPVPSFTTPSEYDRVKQFLTMDRKVLRFSGLWDDSESLFGDTRPVTIHYYLVDDTVEVREVHEPNSGRDPFPILMRRQRLPKKSKAHISNFPTCVLEVSKDEVEEYYSPQDFQLGQKISMLGRHFLLCDCDDFTKQYYQRHYPDMELRPVEPTRQEPQPADKKKLQVPPYNGFGTLEDSLQNCLSLVPTPPKKNVIKQLENHNKILRYRAKLESPIEADEDRTFVLSYYLANDMISIYEKSSRNSGFIGGKFLEKMRIPKPDSSTESPQFYSPTDFAIGATVEVFGHRFVLTDADRYVLTYLESIQSQVPTETLDSLRRRFGLGTDTTEKHGEDAVVEPSSLN